MNDELLYQLRRAPRPEFAQALYRRISRPAKPALPLLGIVRAALRPAALGLAAVALSLLLALAVSPAARAQVANLLQLHWTRIPIGGMVFSQGSLPTNTARGLAADDARVVSLAEAQAALPALRVPAWAPAGFALSEAVLVGRPAWIVQPWTELPLEADSGVLRVEAPFVLLVGLTWREEVGEDEITLEVIRPRRADVWEEYVWIVDWRGSLAELEINGRSVALLRAGGWIHLQWLQEDGLLYRLAAPETAVSEDDLARMAETIR